MCLGTGVRSDHEAAVVRLRNDGAVGKVGKEISRFSNLAAIKVGALKITEEFSLFQSVVKTPLA